MLKAASFFVFTLFTCLSSYAQNYSFNGTISEEVLENYLDKSINMSGLSSIEGNNPTPAERTEDINMLIDIGAKFIGRTGQWWESGWGQANMDLIFDNLEQNVCDLKSQDKEIIIQGGIFEYVSTSMNQIDVPSWVFIEFGLPVVTRKFKFIDMMYDNHPSNTPYQTIWLGDSNKGVPDMSKLETQMWFYYMGRRMIDAGCEALHFGQVHFYE